MKTTFLRIGSLAAVCVFTLSMAFSQAAPAPAKPEGFKLMISGALEFGGDAVAEVLFTNGDVNKMNAGQGGTIAAGVAYQSPNFDKLSVRASVGIKYLTIQADNAHIRLTRVPLVLTAGVHPIPQLRIAAGLSSHQAIKVKFDGIGEDFVLEPTVAPTFEVTFRNIGLVYTPMKYTDEFGETYSANAFGVTFAYLFVPKKAKN
jgi:hypothetical protein